MNPLFFIHNIVNYVYRVCWKVIAIFLLVQCVFVMNNMIDLTSAVYLGN